MRISVWDKWLSFWMRHVLQFSELEIWNGRLECQSLFIATKLSILTTLHKTEEFYHLIGSSYAALRWDNHIIFSLFVALRCTRKMALQLLAHSSEMSSSSSSAISLLDWSCHCEVHPSELSLTDHFDPDPQIVVSWVICWFLIQTTSNSAEYRSFPPWTFQAAVLRDTFWTSILLSS
jgi:hypothetical protein